MEDLGISIENVSPLFLVKKSNGTYQLVTAFTDIAQFCRPTPSKMPHVNEALARISQWRCIITTDLSVTYCQIPLSSESLNFCSVITPFKAMHAYTHCAMGFPGRESALKKLTCKLFGHIIQRGNMAKLADDLHLGANTSEEHLSTWCKPLQILDECNMELSASKTMICLTSTTMLCWLWEGGNIQATKHRLNTLITRDRPKTDTKMRSFVES